MADHGRFDGCSFRGAMMMTSNFRHGSFKGADLRNSVLNGCDFRDCDLADVKLMGTEAYSVKVPPSFDLESHLANSSGPRQLEPR
ncbi:pentapeptide repeat-containing protein [Pseudomonas sp.]|uniref:pentapeptide repeat-containing protein n=1 Tax=Pseudomonas sp. TaxID=306 RepID=UPI0039C94E96